MGKSNYNKSWKRADPVVQYLEFDRKKTSMRYFKLAKEIVETTMGDQHANSKQQLSGN